MSCRGDLSFPGPKVELAGIRFVRNASVLPVLVGAGDPRPVNCVERAVPVPFRQSGPAEENERLGLWRRPSSVGNLAEHLTQYSAVPAWTLVKLERHPLHVRQSALNSLGYKGTNVPNIGELPARVGECPCNRDSCHAVRQKQRTGHVRGSLDYHEACVTSLLGFRDEDVHASVVGEVAEAEAAQHADAGEHRTLPGVQESSLLALLSRRLTRSGEVRAW
jgi:hypothetical protein